MSEPDRERRAPTPPAREASRADLAGRDRVICNRCGARGWRMPDAHNACAECGGAFRPMGPLEGLIDRWFGPPEKVSEFYPRHLKLIELMWTANGRGHETYAALGLRRVSYTQFVTRATEVVVRGLREGWIVTDVPAAPTPDDTLYRVRFLEPLRWADELAKEFDQSSGGEVPGAQVRSDIEGDPDLS